MPTIMYKNKIISGGTNGNISITSETETTKKIKPNLFYQWGEMANLSIELIEPEDSTIINEYMFQFTSGSTATILTLPDSVSWIGDYPDPQPNTTYQCTILNGIGVMAGA